MRGIGGLVGKMMWSAIKVGPRHWEENLLVVDWKSRALLAFASAQDAAAFAKRDETEEGGGGGQGGKGEKEGEGQGEAEAVDGQGRLVCSLVGLQVSDQVQAELREECAAVTCGDYTQVVMLSPPNDENLVCILGVEDATLQAWIRWLENSASVCDYLESCAAEGVQAEKSLFEGLKENPNLLGSVQVDSDQPFASSLWSSVGEMRSFFLLINAHTRDLRVSGIPLAARQAVLLSDGFRNYQSLCTLELPHCSIDATVLGLLCKGLVSVSSHLEVLDLGHNSFADEGAAALGETLCVLSSLRELKLEDNAISALGARALAYGCQRLGQLRVLSLHTNDLGDSGFAAVAKTLGRLAYLEMLYLSECSAVAESALQALLGGLIENTNISVVGGLHVIDLQENFFESSAIKRFLVRCSGLGCPHVIKLGRKRTNNNLIMSMEDTAKETWPGEDGDAPTSNDNPQLVNIGFDSGGEGAIENGQGDTGGAKSPPRPSLEVVFGSEISPFRLLGSITSLLGLFPGQVRLRAGQAYRRDSMQVAILEIYSEDGMEESHADTLVTLFREGNATLHLLHVASIRPCIATGAEATVDGMVVRTRLGDDDGMESTAVNTATPRQVQQPPSPVSVFHQSAPENDLIESDLALRGDANDQPSAILSRIAELSEDLQQSVRDALLTDRVGTSMVDLRAQLHTVGRGFAFLNLFTPSTAAELGRYVLEAKLAHKGGSGTSTGANLPPLVANAVARLAVCSPSDLLILRAYFSAMYGNVERCVGAAEQGKHALGLMLSLSDVSSFESATLQAAVVAQDAEMFALVMDQDLSEDDIASSGIRLAGIVHRDLFSRSLAFDPHQLRERAFDDNQQGPSGENLDAQYAGLVKELLRFERLSSHVEPRELRLQYTAELRAYPITRPINSSYGTDGGTNEQSVGRFWKSIGTTRLEQTFAKGANKICGLLQRAMGDAPRATNDMDGYGAAHEAIGIAFNSREIGLVDELFAQLLCQVHCNPSVPSLNAGWRLLVLCLRILEPSLEMARVLSSFVEGRTMREDEVLRPNRMLGWAQEALKRLRDVGPEQRKLRHLLAGDASVRLDVVRQVMCDEDTFDVQVICANGTGTTVTISPFTSFEELLQLVHCFSTDHLTRQPTQPFQRDGERGLDDKPALRARTDSGATAGSGHHFGSPDTFERRWKDFCFTHFDSAGERHVMSWETDVYWWRWEKAVAAALTSAEESQVGEPAAAPVKLHLESFVCAPSLWYFGKTGDAVRSQLLYWQRQAGVLQGDLCTSNPEALAYLCCLSACVRIAASDGNCHRFLQFDLSQQVRLCRGHLPKIVRKRTAKQPESPWSERFDSVVSDFAGWMSQSIQATADALETDHGANEETPGDLDETTLQRAYLAYLDTWPLAKGVVFRSIRPMHLALQGNIQPLLHFDNPREHRARLVLNAKGIFILVLTNDSHSSRAVALLWHTPLDEIMRLSILDTSTLHIDTRKDQFECSCENPSTIYKAIVAQCTANLSMGNPLVSMDHHLVQFASSFRALPWPPKPPPLYNLSGDPVCLDDDTARFRPAFDLSTAASVLAQLL